MFSGIPGVKCWTCIWFSGRISQLTTLQVEMALDTSFSDSNTGMSKWQKWLWPVHVSELNKFLPLFFIKLLISFNYTILNATKDTIVVTTSGAEIIPVLKGGVVFGVAFLVMLLYTKMTNVLDREKLFYIIMAPFIAFFLLYGFILFPNIDNLVPHSSANWLLSQFGSQHAHWIGVYKYWMNSCFFVLSELWGGLMIGVLFWGFANQVTNIKDAARFYALYTAGGHLGTIFAGTIIFGYSQAISSSQFAATVRMLMLLVTVTSFAIMLLYWWANKHLLEHPEMYTQVKGDNNKGKTKLSLGESIKYIIKCPYVGLIAVMVIGYGLAVNMVEVSWKAILKIQYPNPHDYQAYMGILQLLLGFASLFIAIVIGGNMIRRIGWYLSAQLTPFMLGLTSAIFFFLFLIFPNYQTNPNLYFGMTPLMLIVVFGTVHNIVCKAMKYCLFDPTKEMAYIPLEQEAKVKGKAAVDLVGARFGKFGASWLQLLFIDLIGAGSILGVIPLLVPCVFIAVACWALAVHNLKRRFARKRARQLSESGSAQDGLALLTNS